VTFHEIAMVVPRIRPIAAAEIVREAAQLNESHPALHQPAGQQALAGISSSLRVGIIHPVHLLRDFRLAGDVAQFGHGGLHAPRHLVVLDGRLHVHVVVHGAGEVLVHRAYEVEALSNREVRELVIARLLEEGVDFVSC